MSSPHPPVLSVMLAVMDARRAVEWYERALGAQQLWNLGSVVGLNVQGAAFFVGEPANNGWESPERLGAAPAGRIRGSLRTRLVRRRPIAAHSPSALAQ